MGGHQNVYVKHFDLPAFLVVICWLVVVINGTKQFFIHFVMIGILLRCTEMHTRFSFILYQTRDFGQAPKDQLCSLLHLGIKKVVVSQLAYEIQWMWEKTLVESVNACIVASLAIIKKDVRSFTKLDVTYNLPLYVYQMLIIFSN